MIAQGEYFGILEYLFMFAIYTPNGRTFSGTLEELREVKKSNKPVSARKHHFLDELSNATEENYQVTPNAIDAYKKVIKKKDKISPIYHAYQVMSSPVEVLRGSHLLTTAIEKLQKSSHQVFPIIDDNEQLIGMLSRQKTYEYMLNSKSGVIEKNKNKTLAELFFNGKSAAYSADPVTDIRRIALLFIENNIHSMPIVEDSGRIVGIITRADIVKAAIKEPPLSLWC